MSWAQRIADPKLTPPGNSVLDFLYGEWGDTYLSFFEICCDQGVKTEQDRDEVINFLYIRMPKHKMYTHQPSGLVTLQRVARLGL
jgi:hypothetical protein